MLREKNPKFCSTGRHWLIVARFPVSGAQLGNWNNVFLYQWGSSLERRGTRQVCHLVRKQAAWHLASSVPGLWGSGRKPGKLPATIPIPQRQDTCWDGTSTSRGERNFRRCGHPLRKLLAFCTAHLTQQTRDKRVLGKHFLFTFHSLSFAVTSGAEYSAFAKAAETTSLGNFYSGCFLIWDGSNM